MSEPANPFARFALASARSAGPPPPTEPAPATATATPPKSSSDVKNERKRERSASPPSPAIDSKKARSDGPPDDRRRTLFKALLRAREATLAPIDQFGTQACVWAAASERVARFQLLAAALLSAQTRDEITFAAMQRLHVHSNSIDGNSEGLTATSVLTTSADELSELLKPVGFYRRKAQQLRSVASILRSQFGDDVPQSLDELEALPGVGPKVARVTLLLAWGHADGVVVDTHVHRVAQRLGWAGSRRSSEGRALTAEDTRKEIEAWLPREHWSELSLAAVGFGQSVCSAKRPACGSCPLSKLCPSAFKTNK